MWHELWECLRVSRIQASLLLYTTCVRCWCNQRANYVAAKYTNKKKLRIIYIANL